MRKVVVLALATSIALLIAAAPSPIRAGTTWTVKVGAAGPNQATQALRFLPQTITINEGDTLQWNLTGAEHTIFFQAGEKLPDLIVPGKQKGELLWNPTIFFPSPAKTYDGSGPLSGGALLVDPNAPKSYAVTFTKAGSYNYVCAFHPGMVGVVKVQSAGSPYPKTQTEYEQIAAQEAQTALAKAQALLDATKPVATRAAGGSVYTLDLVGSTSDAATFYRFPGQTLTIRRGDTVTWAMKDPTELHTVTFGGKRGLDIVTMKPQKQGPPVLLVTPAAIQPAGGKVHRGSGFYNSGFLLTEGPGVRSYTLTFSRPGTFEYTCLVHEIFGMKATIVVK